MITGDLEIIDRDGALQDLMLDFFDDDILAVDQHKDITSTKLSRFRPTLYGRVERMGRSSDNLLTAYKDVDKLRGLIDIGFRNPA